MLFCVKHKLIKITISELGAFVKVKNKTNYFKKRKIQIQSLQFLV